jgi:hypothetical protein
VHALSRAKNCGCALPEKPLSLASACQLSRFLVSQLGCVLNICGNSLSTFRVVFFIERDSRVRAPSYFAEARQSGHTPRIITFFQDLWKPFSLTSHGIFAASEYGGVTVCTLNCSWSWFLLPYSSLSPVGTISRGSSAGIFWYIDTDQSQSSMRLLTRGAGVDGTSAQSRKDATSRNGRQLC